MDYLFIFESVVEIACI